jgi:hypothetical protein
MIFVWIILFAAVHVYLSVRKEKEISEMIAAHDDVK